MNIYVSGLSFKLNDADLRQLFEEYGEVSSAKIIMDKFTGRSRGFGFVEMNDEDGQKAIDALNEAEVDGKVIGVSVARPREERPRNNFNRGGGGGGGFNKGGGGGGRNNDRDGGGYGKKNFNRW
ncbi:MAG: RNA-binding protein [Chitinophagales bacterium]|jgi:RNA recognition motif-containing protein|nr:RNA-binding protein [Bacteroidota bacterium]MBP9880380.1 RNA-binding protein [Chitinophagales bacterium]MBK9506411.1 RNA-binding protein [Bacteroidota bacterium]MBK9557794.1 RNA-binding protein [Bacteroidota bacterium]MBL0281760.1 RNA-binding protein [Bacteroidota bacterium]